MDITFLKDWKNPINGKTIKSGTVAGIHYKVAEELIESEIATITGMESAKLKKILPSSVEDLKTFTERLEEDNS